MKRFWVAMGMYAVLAILAWSKLTAPLPRTAWLSGDFQVRHVVVVILAGLAVSTWGHQRHTDRAGAGDRQEERE